MVQITFLILTARAVVVVVALLALALPVVMLMPVLALVAGVARLTGVMRVVQAHLQLVVLVELLLEVLGVMGLRF